MIARLGLVLGLLLLAGSLCTAQENLVPWHRIGASGQFDMMSDDTTVGMSATVGQCAVGWSEDDAAVGAGFWYVIWTTGMHVYVGWNWPSLPTHPMYPEASAVFGPWIRNNLFRWDRVHKTTQYYPDDFRDTEVGQGYMIWGREPQDPVYSGYVAYPDFEIPLPVRGWSWIGYPHMFDMPEAHLLARNDLTGQVRTCWDDWHAPDPWVNWNMAYWDPVARTTKLLSPFGGGDDDTMHEWFGYMVWSNSDQVTLIAPVQ
jgi:hypothetical protein